MPDPPFSAPAWWTVNDVDRLLGPPDSVVPFLGAGVSKGAGLPDAEQLATWLRTRVPFLSTPDAGAGLFTVVDAIDTEQLSPGDIQRLVAAHIEGQPLAPTPFLSELVRLPSRFIITLNYDDLLGVAAEQAQLPVRRLSMLNDAERIEAHRRITAKDWPPGELTILHFHGRAADPKSLVLDTESYNRLIRLPEVPEIILFLAHQRSMVFAGTALDEPYLLTELQKQLNPAYHAVLCRERDLPQLTSGRAALSRRQHIKVIGYPDHHELSVLAQWLTASQPPRGAVRPTGELAVADGVPDSETYVMSEFVDRTLESGRVDEAGIRDAHRTLVVGGAGTGKSHLISWLAAHADKPAVRIRLADVLAQAGRPEKVLAAWSAKARSSPDRPAVDVSPSALRDDRLHFLLDGLDEVANEQQHLVATLVDEIASRYPQHAFTVTSRPIPALAVFGDPDAPDATPWQRLELKPGVAWQERYLAAHGLALEQLEAEMPVLSDMRDLLHTPFLLSHTVRLYEREELGGLRDIGGLLGRLVDVALTREEELLPLVGIEASRSWLRRVALAATIAGRRTFTFDELLEVTVADDLVGDLDNLVQQLQMRLLLSEEDGQLRFSHRYIADQLTAEALVETPPTDTLLDAFVPVVDDELVGVRDDAVIAVTLTCLRSATWRRAVAERDPLAAARATPIDAPPDERGAAIELLWKTYDDWGIWNWDRAVPDLVEDAEVLARLLRAEPDDARVTRQREAIHTGDAVQQGNAIRVLTRVDPEGFEDDLRAVLQDESRDGVVIRQAAISAADLDLKTLIDDIVGAMIASPDSVVQQDCSIALRQLVPDEDLLRVASTLVRGRSLDAAMFAALVKQRLTAPDRIRLSYLLAVERVDTLHEDRLDLSNATAEADATPELVAAAALAAAMWRIDTTNLLAFLDHDRVATARGLIDAHAHGAESWDVIRLAGHADLNTLKAAQVDDRIIERVEHQRELDAITPEEREELRRSIEASLEQTRREYEAHEPPPLQLAELLRTSSAENDAELNYRANELSSQVRKLDPQDLDALRRWLAQVWPTKPFKDLIIVNGPNYRLNPPASAWLFLAPPAGMPVTDDQWGQLAATSPMRITEQADWLRVQATSIRMKHAVDMMSETSPRAWRHLLACCSSPTPSFVAEACLARVEAEPDKSYETQELASRLIDSGLVDAAQIWAARDALAAADLRAMLAERNDIAAQRALVASLVADTPGGTGPGFDEFNWMAALRAPEFLPDLFELLERLYPSTPHAASEFRPRSALNPTINAIQNIGTRDAVRRYDELLRRRDQRRWLRSYRDKIAANVLRAAGDAAALEAAAAVTLPYFNGRS